MKQITITIAALMMLFTTTLFAQKTEEKLEKDPPKHELSVDVLELILFKKFELSYNYLLNDSESIGSTISFFPDNEYFWDFEGYQENFSVDFNYRHYFSKKYAQGFYVETFAKYSYGKVFGMGNYTYNSSDFKRYHALDVGFGIGYKYVSKRNFYIDTNVRLSRNILSSISTKDATYYLPNIKPDFSISFGKRF